ASALCRRRSPHSRRSRVDTDDGSTQPPVEPSTPRGALNPPWSTQRPVEHTLSRERPRVYNRPKFGDRTKCGPTLKYWRCSPITPVGTGLPSADRRPDAGLSLTTILLLRAVTLLSSSDSTTRVSKTLAAPP